VRCDVSAACTVTVERKLAMLTGLLRRRKGEGGYHVLDGSVELSFRPEMSPFDVRLDRLGRGNKVLAGE